MHKDFTGQQWCVRYLKFRSWTVGTPLDGLLRVVGPKGLTVASGNQGTTKPSDDTPAHRLVCLNSGVIVRDGSVCRRPEYQKLVPPSDL